MTKSERLRFAQTFLSLSYHFPIRKKGEMNMRNKNNTETNVRKTEISTANIELALMLIAVIVTAFAAGYFAASAQIASLLAQ